MKLKIAYTCSDHVKHQHKWKITAYLCGRIQYIQGIITFKPQNWTEEDEKDYQEWAHRFGDIRAGGSQLEPTIWPIEIKKHFNLTGYPEKRHFDEYRDMVKKGYK